MRPPKFSILLLGFVALSLCTATRAADPNEFVDFSEAGLPGRLYVPPEAATSTRPVTLAIWPTVTSSDCASPISAMVACTKAERRIGSIPSFGM